MNFPISVIIPTYQRADLISETIDSILAQSLAPAEVIVVDDDSSDDTATVCASYGTRVKYTKIARGGVQSARNTGAALATSPWLAFCDSDDLWKPNHLESAAKLITVHPELKVVFGNFMFFGDHVEGPWKTKSMFEMAPQGFWEIAKQEAGDGAFLLLDSIVPSILDAHDYVPFWPSATFIAKEHFHRLGGYDLNMCTIPGEDFEFTFRCLMRSEQIGVVIPATVGIRKHSGNNRANSKFGKVRQIIGDVVILGYILRHEELNDDLRIKLRNKVCLLCAEAIDFAFLAGQRDYVREFSRICKSHCQSFSGKTKIKIAVSYLPFGLDWLFNRILIRGGFYEAHPIRPYLRSRFDETVVYFCGSPFQK